MINNLRSTTLSVILLGFISGCSKKTEDTAPSQTRRELNITSLYIKFAPISLSPLSPTYVGVGMKFISADGKQIAQSGPEAFIQTSFLPTRRTVFFNTKVIANVDGPVEINVYTTSDPSSSTPVKVGTVHMNIADRNNKPSQDFSEGGTTIEVESTFK